MHDNSVNKSFKRTIIVTVNDVPTHFTRSPTKSIFLITVCKLKLHVRSWLAHSINDFDACFHIVHVVLFVSRAEVNIQSHRLPHFYFKIAIVKSVLKPKGNSRNAIFMVLNKLYQFFSIKNSNNLSKLKTSKTLFF